MKDLVKQAIAGRRKALQSLYENTSGQVYSICITLLKDTAAADDTCQRVYRQLWPELQSGKIESEEEFKALAIQKAVVLCKKQVLKKNSKAYHLPAGRNFLLSSMMPMAKKDESELEVILQQFSPLQKLVFVLSTFTDLPAHDLAPLADMDEQTYLEAVSAQDVNIRSILKSMDKGEAYSFRNVPEQQQIPQQVQQQILTVIDQISEPVEKSYQKKALTFTFLGVAVAAILILAIIFWPAPPVTGDGAALPNAKITHYATIEIENYGKITVALFGESAPKTVENFVALAESGFYSGTTFHRIIEGFMMQGGAPKGSDKAENIYGEFKSNGFENNILHTRGVISMARAEDPNSASSQFFIMHEDAPHLDGDYAAFGCVIEGMDVVDKVCTQVKNSGSNGAVAKADQPVIKSVTVTKATDK